MHPISTFSIVGRDPKTGELGIAVQSKFLAVGAMVCWAKAGPDVTAAVQARLRELGYYAGPVSGVYDDLSKRAYSDWCGVENYEERICEGDFFDERVLNILLQKS